MAVRFITSDRGFRVYQEVPTDYGHVVQVYESSSAEGPHLWLRVRLDSDGAVRMGLEPGDQAAHLSLEQARTVRDTLDAAIAGHYQVRPS